MKYWNLHLDPHVLYTRKRQMFHCIVILLYGIYPCKNYMMIGRTHDSIFCEFLLYYLFSGFPFFVKGNGKKYQRYLLVLARSRCDSWEQRSPDIDTWHQNKHFACTGHVISHCVLCFIVAQITTLLLFFLEHKCQDSLQFVLSLFVI